MKFHWFHGMPWPHLHYSWYVGKHFDPRWANAPPSPEPSFDERITSGTLIAGSPESVTEPVEDLVKRLKVGHLIGVLQFGDMPHDLINRNTRLFAEHVEHGSPKPLNTAHRFDQSRTQPTKSEQARTLELTGVN